MSALVTLWLLAASPEVSWPVRIDGLELHGLSTTQSSVIVRELPWRAGEVVSQAQWELGVARLWNTDLFSRIDARVERLGELTVAVFDLEEHFSLNPLISFGVGGGRFWFRLGATDNNWLGRALEWGARYERFDAYNGGQGWLRDPRLFGQRVGGTLQLDYLMRPRPNYSRRRLAGMLELSAEPDAITDVGARLEVFHDDYVTPLEGEPVLPPALTAAQLTGHVRVGRIDTVRLRRTGWSFEVRETVVAASSGPSPVALQNQLEALGFWMLGERFNVALRGQAGWSSAVPTELGYWLGGLDLIRGYADGVVRTERYALANAEFRATLFDSTWFAVVAAAFVDGALADEHGLRGLLSAGGGVRLLVPKLVKTGIRADLAVTLTGVPALGVSLGVYQFF